MAIVVLDDILRRMSGHQRKKTALLRPLNGWGEGNRGSRQPLSSLDDGPNTGARSSVEGSLEPDTERIHLDIHP